MALKKFNSRSPGTRHLIQVSLKNISKVKPLKSHRKGLKNRGGRNNYGRLVNFKQGGGHKKLYRIIDFKRNSFKTGTVETIEYDPNRSAFIARIKGEDKKSNYILAPSGLKIGDILGSGKNAKLTIGSAMPLRNIPIGTTIHNIELNPGQGGQLARSAGTYGKLLVKRSDSLGAIRLSSGELRLIPLECFATIGSVSNRDHKNKVISKAGRSRWLNKRPTVRGVAMNPIDHPHGGGEGKTSGGRPSVSPWGKLTKGPKTRNSKKKNPFILEKAFQKVKNK